MLNFVLCVSGHCLKKILKLVEDVKTLVAPQEQ